MIELWRGVGMTSRLEVMLIVVKIAYLYSCLLLLVKVSKQGDVMSTYWHGYPDQKGHWSERTAAATCIQHQHIADHLTGLLNVTAGLLHYGALLSNLTHAARTNPYPWNDETKRVSTDRWPSMSTLIRHDMTTSCSKSDLNVKGNVTLKSNNWKWHLCTYSQKKG